MTRYRIARMVIESLLRPCLSCLADPAVREDAVLVLLYLLAMLLARRHVAPWLPYALMALAKAAVAVAHVLAS